MKNKVKPKVLILVEAGTLAKCFQDVAEIYPHDSCRDDVDGIILVGMPGSENIHAGTDPTYGNIFDVSNMLRNRYNGKKFDNNANKFYTPKNLIFGVRSLATNVDALSIAKKHNVDLLFTFEGKIKNVLLDNIEDSVPQIVATDSFVFPDCVDKNVEYVIVDLQNWKKLRRNHSLSQIAEAVAADSAYAR